MIFVTVGTHEQQFNRLVEYIDNLKKEGILQEDVIIQIGFCTYEPKYCTWSRLFPYQDMLKYVSQARIVITHGGPSSFIMPLQVGKIPVVVPRQKEFGEHVNNHQVEFCKIVEERQKNIIVITQIDELKSAILDYCSIVSLKNNEMTSNNKKFNESLEKIVNEL